ncbi:MAG: LacI family transcriptional regulator [Tannerella sp.]|jgi:LacI family transcriptional regulator|nr:LacI family transcriptional regulator [Tannerella sp.]
MKRTSIKDIAQAVGVSAATVSIVLTGKAKNGRVSKEMVEKIKVVAKEMNYQPNRLARSLQSGQSQTIGLLIADILNPFFANLAFHIQEEMRKAGYAVIIMNTDEDSQQMEEMIELMQCRQVDGFIIVPAESGEQSIQQLVDHYVPLVLIDRYYPNVQTSNVLIDNFDASYQATQYLIQQGCRNIALFIYDTRLPHMEGRVNGYMEAMKENKLYDDHFIKKISYKNITEDICKELQSVAEKKELIDGIVFGTNTIAVIALKQLFKLKVKVPEDVRVVCFDKSEVFDFLPVPIPYIQQPIQSMARMASRLLLEQLEDTESRNGSTYRLPAELIS